MAEDHGARAESGYDRGSEKTKARREEIVGARSERNGDRRSAKVAAIWGACFPRSLHSLGRARPAEKRARQAPSKKAATKSPHALGCRHARNRTRRSSRAMRGMMLTWSLAGTNKLRAEMKRIWIPQKGLRQNDDQCDLEPGGSPRAREAAAGRRGAALVLALVCQPCVSLLRIVPCAGARPRVATSSDRGVTSGRATLTLSLLLRQRLPSGIPAPVVAAR
jgi:hypothetical protein